MNMRPTPGRAFITPESRFTDTGLIEIPEKYRQKKKAVARVAAWEPCIRFKCARCKSIQHIKGSCRRCQGEKMRMISTEPVAPFAGDITGLRVLYLETSVNPIADGIFALPIDDIVAIIPDGFELDNAEDDGVTPRCRYCGPCQEGSTNSMLMVYRKKRYVCPRCHKDQNGIVIGD